VVVNRDARQLLVTFMNRVLVVNYEAGKDDGGQESLPETRSSLNYEFNFH